MRIFTRFLSMLMVLLSILLFVSHTRSQVANLPRLSSASSPGLNKVITSPPRYSSESSDSCNLKIYIEDDSIADDAFSCPPGYADSVCRIGNLFPDTSKSGVIKSMDMYFTQYGSSSAISTIVYIYAADQHTILGQSAPFTPTADTLPSGTWCHATFSDIPYTGPFYAMFDMNPNIYDPPNFFDLDTSTYTAQYPYGYGYTYMDWIWTPAIKSQVWEVIDPHATFLERVNVCENGVVGIKQLTPASISMYPNPARDKITIEIAEGQAPSQLSMMNLNGEEVLTRSLIKPKTQIDISNLPGGVYFVRLTNNKTVEVGKFVKQ